MTQKKTIEDLRCEVTNHLCGTDTWGNGYECQCSSCQLWVRDKSKTEKLAYKIANKLLENGRFHDKI